MSKLTRRDWLKLTLAGAGAALTPWPWRTSASAATESPPDLVISKGTSPTTITKAAIQALGGMRRFVSRGDVVLVKPNIAWVRTPAQACNTNPKVVATLVRLCLDAGAKEVKVFDYPFENNGSYAVSGIMGAAKRAGAQVSYVDWKRFRKMDLKGEAIKTWEVYPEAVEVDKMINCPILKHHSLTYLTMGMKNLMGLVGGERGKFHPRINQAIVDLAAFFKPTLVVIDAVRVLTAMGPEGLGMKYIEWFGKVAAGVDQVAVDAIGAKIFGVKPEEMEHLHIASKRGLGRMDLGKLRIKEITAKS